MKEIIPIEVIQQKIFMIRGHKVMLDKDLAELYGVETKTLNRAVKRNMDRFPGDFMFQLSKDEYNTLLRYQIGTLKRGQHSKYLPYIFTENGVAMLSSVLTSKRAIHVNIQIMRTFTKIRKMLASNATLARKLNPLKRNMMNNSKLFLMLFVHSYHHPKRSDRRSGLKEKIKIMFQLNEEEYEVAFCDLKMGSASILTCRGYRVIC